MTTPEEDHKPSLADIVLEIELQACRVRAVVKAFGLAYQDTDEELLFESLERLLNPLCDSTSQLSDALRDHATSVQEYQP